MNDIEWEEDDICYADGLVWRDSPHNPNCVIWETNIGHCLKCRQIPYGRIMKYEDFQINEPRQGDYIPKSELGTEQKYNAAVEVFELLRFEPNSCFASYQDMYSEFVILIEDGKLYQESETYPSCQRKITYNQLMAIGKLKRLMNEREDGLSGHFIGLEKAIHSRDFDNIVFHSDNILDFNSNITEGEERDTKASKAYNLLKSMDIHYDEDLKLWYKKEFL